VRKEQELINIWGESKLQTFEGELDRPVVISSKIKHKKSKSHQNECQQDERRLTPKLPRVCEFGLFNNLEKSTAKKITYSLSQEYITRMPAKAHPWQWKRPMKLSRIHWPCWGSCRSFRDLPILLS
jgi:hypothetical protein